MTDATEKDRAGFVYVIARGNRRGVYKIGRTTNIENRLRSLNVACPQRAYSVVYKVYTDRPKAVELSAHRALATHRLKGEWFRVGLTAAKLALQKACDGDRPQPRITGKPEVAASTRPEAQPLDDPMPNDPTSRGVLPPGNIEIICKTSRGVLAQIVWWGEDAHRIASWLDWFARDGIRHMDTLDRDDLSLRLNFFGHHWDVHRPGALVLEFRLRRDCPVYDLESRRTPQDVSLKFGRVLLKTIITRSLWGTVTWHLAEALQVLGEAKVFVAPVEPSVFLGLPT